MSNSVDQRIVEMQFDNSQFEKGVASTLKSLLSLEQGLQLKDGVSGIQQVQSAAEKLSFSSAEKEVSGLSSALGGLKETATNVFDHIANGVGTLVKGYSIVKGLFSAGIGAMAIQGGWNRASNINKAAFKLDAMGVGWANVQKQVQASVDGTAYSLDAAASAAAMFASSGVEVAGAGDQMEQSLKAVANLASVSGSSFEQMSDIFAKVAAQGKLSGMQVQSLAFASVDAAGIFRRQLGWSAEQFSEAQRKGLIDFQTFVDVVNKEYGDAAGLANKSFDGALANMRSALSRTFADLFQYGQQGMIPIFNGIRETINMVNNALNPLIRTWTTFDEKLGETVLNKGVLIRGFEDATKAIGKAFHDWGGKWDAEIDGLSKESELVGTYKEKTFERFARIFQMLADGLEGPVAEFNAGVYDLAKGLLDLGSTTREMLRLVLEMLSPIGMAFNDIFGGGAFADATHRFYKGVGVILENLAGLKVSAGFINLVRVAFQGLFGVLKGAGSAIFNVIGGAAQGLSESFKGAWLMASHMIDLFDMMKRAGVETFKALGISLSPLQKLTKDVPILGSLVKIITTLPKGLGLALDAIKGKEGAFEKFSNFVTTRAKNLGKIGKDIGNGFRAMGEGAYNFARWFGDVVVQKAPLVLERMQKIGEALLPILGAVPAAIGAIAGKLAELAKLNGLDLNSLAPYLEGIRKSFELFFSEAFSGNIDVSKLVENLKNAFSVIRSRLERFASDAFKNVFDNLPVPLQNFATKLKGVYDTVSTIVGQIRDRVVGFKDVVVGAFQNSGLDFGPFAEFFTSIGSAIGEFFGGEGEKFDFGKLFESIKEAAGGLVEDVGPKFETFVKGIKDSIYDNLSPALQDIYDKIQQIVTPFENFGAILEDVGNKLGNFKLPDIFSKNPFGSNDDFLGPIFVADKKKTSAFSSDMFDFVQALENIGTLIWSPLSTLKKIFSSGLEGFGQAFKEFIDSLPEDEIKKFVGFISTIGIDAGVVVGLFNMSRAVGAISGIAESIKGVMGKLGGVLGELKQTVSEVQTSLRVHTILELAVAIAILAGALIALTFIDADKLWDVLPILGILTAIMVAMTGFVAVLAGFGSGFKPLMKMSLFTNFEAIGKIAAAMIPMALSIAIVAVALSKLSAINEDELTRGIGAMIAIVLSLAGLAFVVGKFSGPSFAGAATSMLAMAAGVLLMYGAIQLLSGMDDTVFTTGYNRVFMISGIFIAFAFLASLAGSMGSGGGFKGLASAILAMTGAIFAFIKFIEILSDVAPGDIAKGLITAGLIELLMIGFLAAIGYMQRLGKMGRGIRQAVPVLLSMALVIGAVGGVIAALSMISAMGGDVWTGVGALFVSLIGLAGVILALSKASHVSANISVALFSIAIAIGVLTAAVLLMSQVPMDMVLQGVINMAMVMGLFAGAMLVFGAIGKRFGAGLIQLGAALISFGLATLALSGAMFIAVAALALFASAEPAITEALNNFFTAMSQLFSDAEFTKGVLWATLAMTAAGAAAIILGVGLGILALALMLLPPLTKESAESMLAFFNTFTEHKDEFVEGIKNFILAGIEGIGAAAGAVGEAFTEFLLDLANKPAEDPGPMMEAGATIIGNLLLGLLNALGSVGVWLINVVGEHIFNPINEALDQGLTDLGWAINDFFFNNLGIGIDPATRKLGETVKTGVAEGVDGATEAMITKTDELIAATEAKAEEAKQKAASKGPEISQATAQSLSEGKLDFFTLVGLDEATIAGGFDSIKGFFADRGWEVPDEVITQFANGASGFDAWNLLQTNGDVDMSQFTTLMGDAGGEGADSLTQTFSEQMTLADISNLVAAAADIDTEALNEKFSSAAGEAAQAFTQGFSDNIKIDGSGPMEKAAAALKGSTGSMTDAGTSLGKSVDDGFKKGAKGMKSNASSAAKDAVSAVKGQASTAKSGGHDVGYNMGAGLKSGLLSGSNGLASLAASIVSSAISAMKRAAKTQSPSRETIWISEMMMEGLVVGFGHMRDEVVDSAASVMKDSLSAMGDAAYVAGLLDDIDDQPTIRPVLDLTDYEAGINRMKGLNASAPMNSAQWANRLSSSPADSSYYNNNRSMVINLNYGAGTSAADMVNEMAMILQTKNLMEA